MRNRKHMLVRLIEDQLGLCWWCGLVMMEEPPSFRATIEHLKPKWRGGSSRRANLRAACHSCNQKRNRLDQVRTSKAKRMVLFLRFVEVRRQTHFRHYRHSSAEERRSPKPREVGSTPTAGANQGVQEGRLA